MFGNGETCCIPTLDMELRKCWYGSSIVLMICKLETTYSYTLRSNQRGNDINMLLLKSVDCRTVAFLGSFVAVFRLCWRVMDGLITAIGIVVESERAQQKQERRRSYRREFSEVLPIVGRRASCVPEAPQHQRSRKIIDIKSKSEILGL